MTETRQTEIAHDTADTDALSQSLFEDGWTDPLHALAAAASVVGANARQGCGDDDRPELVVVVPTRAGWLEVGTEVLVEGRARRVVSARQHGGYAIVKLDGDADVRTVDADDPWDRIERVAEGARLALLTDTVVERWWTLTVGVEDVITAGSFEATKDEALKRFHAVVDTMRGMAPIDPSGDATNPTALATAPHLDSWVSLAPAD